MSYTKIGYYDYIKIEKYVAKYFIFNYLLIIFLSALSFIFNFLSPIVIFLFLRIIYYHHWLPEIIIFQKVQFKILKKEIIKHPDIYYHMNNKYIKNFAKKQIIKKRIKYLTHNNSEIRNIAQNYIKRLK